MGKGGYGMIGCSRLLKKKIIKVYKNTILLIMHFLGDTMNLDFLKRLDGGVGGNRLPEGEGEAKLPENLSLREKLQRGFSTGPELEQPSVSSQDVLKAHSNSTQTALTSQGVTEPQASNEMPTKKPVGRKTTIIDGMKICPRCEKKKLIEEFKSKDGDSYYGYCLRCYKIYAKELRLSKNKVLNLVGTCYGCDREVRLINQTKVCRRCTTALEMINYNLYIARKLVSLLSE